MTDSIPLKFDVLSISEWWNERQNEPGALTALKKVIDTIDDTRGVYAEDTDSDYSEWERESDVPNQCS